MYILFLEILLKIIFVIPALFILDLRIALITILLLTTPLYVPKLIEKRLQKAQTEYLQAVEENLAKVNDWLSGFEIIKNFSIERQILLKFDESNTMSMDKLLRDTVLWGNGADNFNADFLPVVFYRACLFDMACLIGRILSRRLFCGDRNDRSAFISAHFFSGDRPSVDCRETVPQGYVTVCFAV